MTNEKEVRAFHSVGGIDLRKDEVAEQRYVEGVAVVYNQEEQLWDGYFERIDKDAFKKCLASNPELKCFFNHSADYVLSTTSSTPELRYEDTPIGLFFSSPIPNTSYGKDLIENLSRGNITGASFTFTVNDDEVTVDTEGNYHRTIKDATIFEFGPVTNPAYPMTSIGLRTKTEVMEEARARTSKPVEETSNMSTRNDDFIALVNASEHENRKRIVTILEIN